MCCRERQATDELNAQAEQLELAATKAKQLASKAKKKLAQAKRSLTTKRKQLIPRRGKATKLQTQSKVPPTTKVSPLLRSLNAVEGHMQALQAELAALKEAGRSKDKHEQEELCAAQEASRKKLRSAEATTKRLIREKDEELKQVSRCSSLCQPIVTRCDDG